MADELLTEPLLRAVPVVGGKKLLGPCVLIERVGKGGMGAVYRGRHRKLDIDIAVKCLLPSVADGSQQAISRFEREGKLAARLNHPNVVRVFDVDCLHGIHFIVMEYVRGETARERVARKGGALHAAEALAMAFEAAKGLAAVHGAGIVHRDIKPDNILISSTGEVKLGDLGLGSLAEKLEAGGTLTSTGFAMGTPRYMPPEQWEGLARVGPAGDVWALGATLYFLLTGEDAFSGTSVPEILRKTCLEPFPDVRKKAPATPGSLAAILERATARDPATRYSSGAELARALEAELRSVASQAALADPGATMRTACSSAVSPPPTARSFASAAPTASQLISPPGTLTAPAPRSRPVLRQALIAAALVGVGAAIAIVATRSHPGEAGGPSPQEGQPAASASAAPSVATPALAPEPPAAEPTDAREPEEVAVPRGEQEAGVAPAHEPPAEEAAAAAAAKQKAIDALAELESEPEAPPPDESQPAASEEPRPEPQVSDPVATPPPPAAAPALPPPADSPPTAPAEIGVASPEPARETAPPPVAPTTPAEPPRSAPAASAPPPAAAPSTPAPRVEPAPAEVVSVSPVEPPASPAGGERLTIPGFTWLRRNEQGFHEHEHRATGIVFVQVPGGTFWMGSDEAERRRAAAELARAESDSGLGGLLRGTLDAEAPRHQVTVGPFLLARHELSQATWRKIMGTNPSRKAGDHLPVDSVTWVGAQEFCRRTGLRLPTEAQWERACRAGTETPFGGGAELTPEEGTFAAPSTRGPVPIRQLRPNDFGLIGMHGNVAEWCEDAFSERFYAAAAATQKDPLGVPPPGAPAAVPRAVRGGSWAAPAWSCRSASREGAAANRSSAQRGFRPAFWPLR